MAYNEASYVAVFVVAMIVAAALTVVISKAFDSAKALGTVEVAGLGGALPFPDVYPRIPPPPVDPSQGVQCVNYCASQTTGDIQPCATTKLTPCVNSTNCDDCATKLPFQKITCQAPGVNWPSVSVDQAAMNNVAPKYCLPTREACVGTSLTSCATTDDCRRCTDSLADGVELTCNFQSANTTVTVPRADGSEATLPVYIDGRYCTPNVPACNPLYGTARWSSEEGWKCVCKYPDVMGGPLCDQMIACRANEVLEETKTKQQLLLNMPGVDGSLIGDPWTLASGVDPNKCVNAQSTQIDCNVAGAVQPTVACQCDGIQVGTGKTFTYDTSNSRTCAVDPCYANANGGRTWGRTDKALPTIPNQPATTCACSGADSSLWHIAPALGTRTGQTYTYKGYCTNFTIPRSKITLYATPGDESCTKETNKAATTTGLVSGRKVVNGVTVNTCAADPCAGSYSDSAYRTTADIGVFDATTGTCACVSAAAVKSLGNCDRTVNPVCSTCVNACSLDINTVCPTAPGDNCGNKRCISNPDGTSKCDCGEGCIYANGVCFQKVLSMEPCVLTKSVPGICSDSKETCRMVESWSQQKNNCFEAQGAAVVCSTKDQCGPVGYYNFMGGCGNDITCGGSTDSKFKPPGSSQAPWTWTAGS